jgi:antitoxin MazE
LRVSKWGNSLAVRLPAEVVDNLDLSDGDEVELLATDYSGRVLGIARKLTREQTLRELRKFRGLRPTDYKFDRDEANER